MSRPLAVAAAQMGPIARDETRAQVVERLIDMLREAAGARRRARRVPRARAHHVLPALGPRRRRAAHVLRARDAGRGDAAAVRRGGAARRRFPPRATPSSPPTVTATTRRSSSSATAASSRSTARCTCPATRSPRRGARSSTSSASTSSRARGVPRAPRVRRHRRRRDLQRPALAGDVPRARAAGRASSCCIGYNTPIHYAPDPGQDHLAAFHNNLVMAAGAYQNATWVVGVAKGGVEEGVEGLCDSQIIAPSGEVVARASTDGDEVVVAVCDLDLCDDYKRTVFDFDRYRRPEMYTRDHRRNGASSLPTSHDRSARRRPARVRAGERRAAARRRRRCHLAASEPGSSSRATTSRPGSSTRRTGCSRSSSRCRLAEKDALARSRESRADGVHRPARRDRGERGPRRLEGDAQLGRGGTAPPPAAHAVPAPLPRPGAARGLRSRHHRGAVRVPSPAARPPDALPAHRRRGPARRRRLLRRHPRRRLAPHARDPLSADGRARRRPSTCGPTRTPTSTSSPRCPRATTRGLQLQTPDGWADVVPPDGHVVVNSGIMLERLSNGRIPAGVHRVVADAGLARRPVLRRAVLPPRPVVRVVAVADVRRRRAPAALRHDRSRRAPRPRALRHRPHPPRLNDLTRPRRRDWNDAATRYYVGITALDAADAGPTPRALLAATVNV